MNRLLRLGAALALAGAAGIASAASYTGLYIFGDSLSDPGNLAVAGRPADATQVISGNGYIPSSPYASGQFTNGDVWATSFASALGLSPYAAPALLGGGNFAFGGARVATDAPGVLPPSLAAQTSIFLNATQNHAPSGALYVVAGGGNDARDALARAATSARPIDVIAEAAAKYAKDTGDIVDRLQAAGARNIIVWDVPNLGVVPAVTSQGAGASFLGGLTSSFMSGALAARMHGESGVVLFDVFGLLTQAALNPAAFGLTNVKDACGNPLAGCDVSTALFWDGIHPTAAGHALLAQQMAITAVPEPGTWALLAVGIALLALRRAPARRVAAVRA